MNTKTTNLEQLRQEAKEKMQNVDNMAMRSCWNCNPAHEHLKEAEYVISCFGCGHWFYKGTDITVVEALTDSNKEDK